MFINRENIDSFIGRTFERINNKATTFYKYILINSIKDDFVFYTGITDSEESSLRDTKIDNFVAAIDGSYNLFIETIDNFDLGESD